MKVQGQNQHYTTEISQQAIKKEEFGNDEGFSAIFDMLDTNKTDGTLDSKEIGKAMSIFGKIASSHKDWDNNTVDDPEIKVAIQKNKDYKNNGITFDMLKNFIAKFLELNDSKVKVEFAKSQGLTPSETNSSIAFDKDNKPVLIYNNQLNKKGESFSTYSDKLSVDRESGYYEVKYDLKNAEGKTVYKAGFYDNKNNKISYGYYNGTEQGYQNWVKYAHMLGLKETEDKYVFSDNGKNCVYHPSYGYLELQRNIDVCENGRFVEAKDGKDLRYFGIFNNKLYDTEAEYYIAKKNLNLEVKQVKATYDAGEYSNGTKTIKTYDKKIYVDKDTGIRYDHVGRGNFIIAKDLQIANAKKSKRNGELDGPIYQNGVGNCYMVSAMQGISKYFPNTFKNSGVIERVDDSHYKVNFPGIQNPVEGTKNQYDVFYGDVLQDIDSNGELSSIADPDAIIIEEAFKQFRFDLYSNERAVNRRVAEKRRDNKDSFVESPYNFKSNESMSSYLNLTGNSGKSYSELGYDDVTQRLKADLLTAGYQSAVLKALLPPDTEIQTIVIGSVEAGGKTAAELIKEYSNNGYAIFVGYQPGDPIYERDKDGHAVAYDSEAGQFISTYDPGTFDLELETDEDRNNKINTITVVKIPEADRKTN